MNNLHRTLAFGLVLMGVLLFVPSTFGQLHQDMHDLFENMMPDLDPDVRENFRLAIKKDTPNVSFSVEEFLKFKDNPANPFEGLDQVDIDKIDGEIVLRFELPSLRGRVIGRLERQHRSMMAALNPVSNAVAQSVVSVESKRKQLALGAIVSANGLIVTKASELENRRPLNVLLADGRQLEAKLKRVNKENDLALLQVDATDLKPIEWANEQPLLGTFIVTVGQRARAIGLGTYSTRPRSTSAGKQAFLGVQPEVVPGGIKVRGIEPSTAAAAAGLRNGDVITKLESIPMTTVNDLVNVIRQHRPGDEVVIEYLRNGVNGLTSAKLASQTFSGALAAQFKMMNRLGAIPSRRSDGFPFVFQHDTPLFPEQCGGPLFNLEGQAIGLNIARQGRAASYAIPAGHLKTIISDMLRENIASRK